MTNQFYRAFEDRYRGSREVIKQRLYEYVPFLQALRSHYPDASAIDLGCGRGEWLEVLGEHGFSARGVDLDKGMLAAAQERGLEVSEQDALAALAGLPDQSVTVVSAFHLVEHIPFDTVRALVTEALRVLVPGGLLILETPNPENIVVGSSDFYTDPSHLRPIPPNLLAFVAEHAGYARHAVVRLQEDPNLHESARIDLLAVLSGASPDYSIVAQKNADAGLLASFEQLFSAVYGVDLKSLALRYESQAAQEHAEIHHALAALSERISLDRASTAAEHQLVSQNLVDLGNAHAGLAATLAQTIARLDQLEAPHQLPDQQSLAARIELLERHADSSQSLDLAARIDKLERHAEESQPSELAACRAELDRVRAQLQQTTSELEARLAQEKQLSAMHAQQITALLQSRSWRITAPLRLLGTLARQMRGNDGKDSTSVSATARTLARRTVQAIMRRPRLKRVALALLAYMPSVRTRLRDLLHRHDALHHPVNAPPAEPLPIGEVAPRVAKIYRELKQAQQARK